MNFILQKHHSLWGSAFANPEYGITLTLVPDPNVVALELDADDPYSWLSDSSLFEVTLNEALDEANPPLITLPDPDGGDDVVVTGVIDTLSPNVVTFDLSGYGIEQTTYDEIVTMSFKGAGGGKLEHTESLIVSSQSNQFDSDADSDRSSVILMRVGHMGTSTFVKALQSNPDSYAWDVKPDMVYMPEDENGTFAVSLGSYVEGTDPSGPYGSHLYLPSSIWKSYTDEQGVEHDVHIVADYSSADRVATITAYDKNDLTVQLGESVTFTNAWGFTGVSSGAGAWDYGNYGQSTFEFIGGEHNDHASTLGGGVINTGGGNDYLRLQVDDSLPGETHIVSYFDGGEGTDHFNIQAKDYSSGAGAGRY